MHVNDYVSEMDWGSHVCLFYTSPDSLLRFQLPYFVDGVRKGHACIWVVEQPLRLGEVLEALRAERPDLDGLRSSGQLELLEAGTHYSGDGFDAESAARFWVERQALAQSRGYRGLRISGNVSGHYTSDKWRALMDYEYTTDRYIHERNLISLCCYSDQTLDPGKVADVVSIHQGCFVQRKDAWQLIPNHEFDLVQTRARRQLAELSSIYSHAPIGLCVLDTELRWQRVNESFSRISGLAPGAHIGRRLDEVLPEIAAQAKPALSQSLRTGEPALNVEIQGEAPASPGGRRTWLLNLIPLKDAAGEVTAINFMCEEITERKRQETARESLLEAERAARTQAERASGVKDEFLANVSHELRTPLNAILGWSQVLMAKAALIPADIKSGIEIIARNASTQAKLIEDLLDVSRVISGKICLDTKVTSPLEFISPALEANRYAAEAKGLRIDLQLDPEAASAAIKGDNSRLQQVVSNLLSNAVKFTESPGSITMALQHLGREIMVSISDTGEGISEEFLPSIFQRFSQADSSTTRKHKGLGIGLSLVKHIVEMHGGNAWAASEGKGKGATFSFSLPVLGGPTERRSAAEAARAEVCCYAEPSLDGINVLVVEDEADALELLRRILTQSEARVLTAKSAAEAVEVVKTNEVEVIVSDIGMPDRDGYELMHDLRRLGCQAPAVAVTAFVRREDKEKALSAGYQAHVAKPFEAQEILSVVARLAGRAPHAEISFR